MIAQLRADLMSAMRDKNKDKKELLQMIISGVVNKEKEIGHALSKEEVYSVISKEIKQMEDSLSMTPEDRAEMRAVLVNKLGIAKSYLPKQLTHEEISSIIKDAMVLIGIDKVDNKSRGQIMKAVMPSMQGKADGRTVNAVIDKMIN